MTIHKEKPSRHYIAKAVPCDNGFHARFSAPGLYPRLVARPHSEPTIFEYEAEAEIAAMTALFGILNAPRETQSRGKDMRYQKLSGPEFAVLLAESGLSLTLFAYLYGTSPDRAQSWIDGVDSAPHPARILLEIFKRHPELVDEAEDITAAVTTERRPR
jgi:DNA-binding transcriptional regulator YiaG